MNLCVDFIDADEEMPDPFIHVLLWYRKNEDHNRTGKIGDFLTEGYFDNKRDTWFDFTNRIIMKRNAKIKTRNKVLMWAKIPDDFVYDE
jgi:hypothetical protein